MRPDRLTLPLTTHLACLKTHQDRDLAASPGSVGFREYYEGYPRPVGMAPAMGVSGDTLLS